MGFFPPIPTMVSHHILSFNLPLKWTIPTVQMNHSPSVAPPKSFPGIARFDDTRPDTALEPRGIPKRCDNGSGDRIIRTEFKYL